MRKYISSYIIDNFTDSQTHLSENEVCVYLIENEKNECLEEIVKKFNFKNNVFIIGDYKNLDSNIKIISSENSKFIHRGTLFAIANVIKKNLPEIDSNIKIPVNNKLYEVTLIQNKNNTTGIVRENKLSDNEEISQKDISLFCKSNNIKQYKNFKPQSYYGQHHIIVIPILNKNLFNNIKIKVNKTFEKLLGIKEVFVSFIYMNEYDSLKNNIDDIKTINIKNYILIKSSTKIKETFDVGEPHIAIHSYIQSHLKRPISLTMQHIKQYVTLTITTSNDGYNSDIIFLSGKVRIISIGETSIN